VPAGEPALEIVTVTVADPPDDTDPLAGDMLVIQSGFADVTFQFRVPPPVLLAVNVFCVSAVP